MSILATTRAEIPWPEVVQRLREENRRLADRPGGHNGEYFVLCTLYYTPMESGFTAERGFDTTPETRPGLHGHKYPREFLRAVKKEGFGRLLTPVNGKRYIRYDDNDLFAFATRPVGHGGKLEARSSAAALRGYFPPHAGFVVGDEVGRVLKRTNWRIVDTGRSLVAWQIDLYWGEDEPLGPGKLLVRPRGTEFEYSYSKIRVREGTAPL